jgi:hypothetical protein
LNGNTGRMTRWIARDCELGVTGSTGTKRAKSRTAYSCVLGFGFVSVLIAFHPLDCHSDTV